jgi:hypothetical protein
VEPFAALPFARPPMQLCVLKRDNLFRREIVGVRMNERERRKVSEFRERDEYLEREKAKGGLMTVVLERKTMEALKLQSEEIKTSARDRACALIKSIGEGKRKKKATMCHSPTTARFSAS